MEGGRAVEWRACENCEFYSPVDTAGYIGGNCHWAPRLEPVQAHHWCGQFRGLSRQRLEQAEDDGSRDTANPHHYRKHGLL